MKTAKGRALGFMFGRVLFVDALLVLATTITLLANLEVSSFAGAAVLCALMFAIHTLVWWLPLRSFVAAQRVWGQKGSACNDAELLAADESLDRLPARLALSWTVAWPLYLVGLVALAYGFAYAETYFMASEALSDYFWYVDRARMFELGSLFYATYFIVSVPLLSRLDEPYEGREGDERDQHWPRPPRHGSPPAHCSSLGIARSVPRTPAVPAATSR